VAGGIGRAAGPGRTPVWPGGAQTARPGVRARSAGRPAQQALLDDRRARRPGHPGRPAAPDVLAVRCTEPPPRHRGRPGRHPGLPSTCRRRAGCASAPGRGPRAAAGMGGAGWRWPAPARRRDGRAGCWCAAACPPGSWPITCAPARPSLRLVALVRVAGTRWRMEEAFQAGKGCAAWTSTRSRRWRSRYRWVTLAMLAYAFLVVAAVTEHAQRPALQGRRADLQRDPAPVRRPGHRTRG